LLSMDQGKLFVLTQLSKDEPVHGRVGIVGRCLVAEGRPKVCRRRPDQTEPSGQHLSGTGHALRPSW
jgi:hypothetical protein